MEVVERTLDGSLESVLDRPLFGFLGTVATTGEPRVTPLWYLWEDERIWIIAGTHKTYTTRLERQPQVDFAVVYFDVRTGTVHHVGIRGRAAVVLLEPDRVDRLLRRYLGAEKADWDPAFVDLDPDTWRFIRIDPSTVVARDQSFEPSLTD